MTRILAIAALTVFLATTPLYAQKGAFGESPVYEYPKVPAEYSIWGGYRFTNIKGTRRAGEYIYLEDSIAGGMSIVAFPLPSRIHIDIDLQSEKDYFSDLRYAYKDLILFRSVNRAVFHNFGNITLVDGGGGISRLDPNEEYGYRAAFGTVSLRLKVPNYPAHAFVKTWYMHKDGEKQQRRVGGSGYFSGGYPRVSEKRSVDTKMTIVEAGVNSHLGLLEAQYSHSESRFKAANGVDSADYGFAPGARAAGTYPHSVMPKLEGSTDTIKVHTTYTGRLVASATFSVSKSENKTSSAKVDYYLAAGEVVWTPVSKFTAALRYRYEERDIDNPNTLPAGYLGFSDFTAMTGIRNSISAEINTVSAIARWRPINGVTLGANASHKRTDRKNAAEWGIEDSTEETALGASLSLRALKVLRFKARYRYREFDDPAYNTQPDHSHNGNVSVTFMPHTRIILFGSYGITREKRANIHLLSGTPLIDVGDNRSVSRDTVTATLTYIMLDNLSFTGSYGYWENKTKQDLAYGNISAPAIPIVDRDVEYSDRSANYSASADYSPIEKLHLHAGISYTKAKGEFYPGSAAVLQPVSIASFSRLHLRETSWEFESRYEFPKDIDVGFRYEYRDFEDLIDNPVNPEEKDGSAQTYFVTLNKRW